MNARDEFLFLLALRVRVPAVQLAVLAKLQDARREVLGHGFRVVEVHQRIITERLDARRRGVADPLLARLRRVNNRLLQSRLQPRCRGRVIGPRRSRRETLPVFLPLLCGLALEIRPTVNSVLALQRHKPALAVLAIAHPLRIAIVRVLRARHVLNLLDLEQRIARRVSTLAERFQALADIRAEALRRRANVNVLPKLRAQIHRLLILRNLDH
ncbi:hypothetical protein IVB18_26180 [Bradyrhizobium sp. 186]|uniref:hypothetical protein n=1 Tax=Bradyrhizobium sp. 186 TaxID=2782654 RepID=UPI002000A9C0|nr:hypothetical protein [Bradyrhizobium sp. 186]UPK31820.1 hypothetical protein IVB18_26180 [Bradyrhizobium sp. 186]